MNYQINTKNLSTTTRRSYGKKLECQEKHIDQSLSPPTARTISSTYLTTDCRRKTVSTTNSSMRDDARKRQDMEYKTLGKLGLAKRKQFLQTRDISRSHESLAVTDEETDLSGTRLSISNSLTSVHKQCEEDDTDATNKLLEIGRVASWAVGFEKLLSDDLGLHIFTEFLKKEFSQENIQFWIECEKLKSLSDSDEISTKANFIWSTYLHDTDDGSCRINIDSRTRQECQQSLNKPNAHIFEKAQSQIFQLMKLDSYSRFLKSNMYKECIMSEMEGKSIPYSKQSPTDNEERSKTVDSHVKLKDEEKKDKKRSPLLPWTKAFIKWKRLSAKRDTPSSSSNFHTPLNENLVIKPTSIEASSLANIIKVPNIPSPPLTSIGNINKSTKHTSNINQQDSSLFSSNLHGEMNEKKCLIEYTLTSTIDTSRFCRFVFPDSTSALVLTEGSTSTIQQAINRLFAKRGITWYRTELYSSLDKHAIDIQEALSSLSGKEIRVENRILIRIDFPTRILCVRCDPKRTLLQVLQPILEKLKYTIGQFAFYANDSLIPLNLNELVRCYDNQRIFTLMRTIAGVDLSSRQKIRTTNDIFEMISENDEEIRFDECGILKVDIPSSIYETSSILSENDQVYCGPKR